MNTEHFFNALPQAIALLDHNQNICAINTAFYELTGYENSAAKEIFLDSIFEQSDEYNHFKNAALPNTSVLWLKQFSGNKIKVVAQRTPYQPLLQASSIQSMLSIYAFDAAGLGAHFIAGISSDGCWAWDLVESTTWRSPRWLEIAARTHESAKLDATEVSSMFEFINASANSINVHQDLAPKR